MVVGFARAGHGSRWVHPGWLGSLTRALEIVGFIRCRLFPSRAVGVVGFIRGF